MVYFETLVVVSGPTAVMASPRPIPYVLGNQALSPFRGSDPDSRGRHPRQHGLAGKDRDRLTFQFNISNSNPIKKSLAMLFELDSLP